MMQYEMSKQERIWFLFTLWAKIQADVDQVPRKHHYLKWIEEQLDQELGVGL